MYPRRAMGRSLSGPRLTARCSGRYNVVVRETPPERTGDRDPGGRAPMNALSVIKIPIMVVAYRDSESGRLDLDQRHTVTREELRRGSGLLQTFAPRLSPTLRGIVRQMIITSDNTVTDIAIQYVGMDRVNAWLEAAGYPDTRLRMTTGEIFRQAWVRARIPVRCRRPGPVNRIRGRLHPVARPNDGPGDGADGRADPSGRSFVRVQRRGDGRDSPTTVLHVPPPTTDPVPCPGGPQDRGLASVSGK